MFFVGKCCKLPWILFESIWKSRAGPRRPNGGKTDRSSIRSLINQGHSQTRFLRDFSVSDYRKHPPAPSWILQPATDSPSARWGTRSPGDFGFGDDGDGPPIGAFGMHEPWELLKKLRLFHEAGWELDRGSESLNEVAEAVWLRLCAGRYPADLPVTTPSFTRACQHVSAFFGIRYFLLGRPVELFERKGKRGWACTALSELGGRAWRITRIWLVHHGYVKIESC